MSDIGVYVNRYFVGMKVEVCIPVSTTRVFGDWAIINEIDDDLLSLQLSRDMLPAGVTLRVGQILTIRSERDFQVFYCHAILLSKGLDQKLLLRLTKETHGNELREFFRIDTFLPIKLHTLDDQDFDSVKQQWEVRQLERLEAARLKEQKRMEAKRERQRLEEEIRLQNLLQNPLVSEPRVPVMLEDEPEEDEYDTSWAEVAAAAVNISAGGLKIATSQRFDNNELVLLEMFIPASGSIVESVARVAFVDEQDAATDEAKGHIGLQFVLIDEASRFAINNHISSIQLRRIRHFKGFNDEKPLPVDPAVVEERHMNGVIGYSAYGDLHQSLSLKIVHYAFLCALLASVVVPVYLFFNHYTASHPKNEIQVAFEAEITKLVK